MHKTTRPHPSIFFIEGNIGSGKSTLLTLLQQQKNLTIDIVPAPSNSWDAHEGDSAILAAFYEDMQRWAYTLQSYAFISRMHVLEETISTGIHPTKIFERSVYCDRFCFARNCFENKTMSTLEWEIYKAWFNNLVERYMKLPKGFIYVRADPAICLRRISSRRQTGNTIIDLPYLSRLHKQHDDWLLKKIDVPPSLATIPVLTLNGDHSFMDNTAEVNDKKTIEFLEQIQSFINNPV